MSFYHDVLGMACRFGVQHLPYGTTCFTASLHTHGKNSSGWSWWWQWWHLQGKVNSPQNLHIWNILEYLWIWYMVYLTARKPMWVWVPKRWRRTQRAFFPLAASTNFHGSFPPPISCIDPGAIWSTPRYWSVVLQVKAKVMQRKIAQPQPLSPLYATFAGECWWNRAHSLP